MRDVPDRIDDPVGPTPPLALRQDVCDLLRCWEPGRVDHEEDARRARTDRTQEVDADWPVHDFEVVKVSMVFTTTHGRLGRRGTLDCVLAPRR